MTIRRETSQSQMQKEAHSAPAYPKPGGWYTGFDSVNMHQVWVTSRIPAVRVRLRMAGKPQAAQLGDGTIVVAGFIEPPAHSERKCTLQHSEDNARTFSEPRVLDLPGRPGGFKALKNDTLILASGSGFISRSSDAGRSWTTFKIPDDLIPGRGPLTLGECHGPIELPDGTLMIHVAREVGHHKWEAYVIRSTDEGRTWEDPTRVPTETDADEISYACLSDGRIIGIARCSAAFIKRDRLEDIVPGAAGAPVDQEAGDSPAMFYSDDWGRTWSHPKPTGLGVLQVAGAYPLQLKDGRIVLLYGNRQFPFGVQAVGSRDRGETWDIDHPIVLSWTSWSGYCGHPRSVQLQDGTVLTGYYTQWKAGESPAHNAECAGELVRWRVPDDWPPKK